MSDFLATAPRIVAHVSCGAASFVAWKIAIERYGERVEAVNAYVSKEYPDNRRFLADCERGGRVRLSLRMLRTIDEPKWRIDDEPPIQCGGVCEWPSEITDPEDRLSISTAE